VQWALRLKRIQEFALAISQLALQEVGIFLQVQFDDFCRDAQERLSTVRLAMIKLDEHDAALVEAVVSAFRKALESAHSPSAVVKRIVAITVRRRNLGRAAAIRRHPFKGICEASGLPLDVRDKALDELEPEKGYDGKVRWVCHKGNNSGLRSCGGC
jgi:hypothetical protein